MTHQTDRVNDYYNATVLDYRLIWTGKDDRAMHFGYYDTDATTHSQALLKMNEYLAGKANITRDDKVLDAGCGYGGSSIWLVKHIGCSAVGLNVVPYQVAKATRYAQEVGVAAKVSFAAEDYAHTSFPDGSFDVVWGLESIVHAEDKAQFVQEAFRLLKPGGRLLIAEYMLREEPPLSVDERAELRGWLEGWAMPSLLMPAEYAEYMKSSGFRQIVAHDIMTNVLPSLKRLERFLPFALPISQVFQKFGIFSKTHRGNVEATAVQMETLKKGYWRYIVLVATK